MTTSVGAHRLLLTRGPEIHLKSSRTRRRMHRILRTNLDLALAPFGDRIRLRSGPGERLSIDVIDPTARDEAADAAASVFGIHRVEVAARLAPVAALGPLVDEVTAATTESVAGRRFAVRVRRRGTHDWTSTEAERAIGARLDPHATVDLTDPDITVRVQVWAEEAYLVADRRDGAQGLPLGTQPAALGMLSGGFDSPVAAWMMMRRGVPVDFVHFSMDCSQADHAVAVGYELWRRWGHGSRPTAWIVDFSEVKVGLMGCVDSGIRQVALKQLMFEAASRLASAHGHAALITGEAVGQVSTQTLANLVEIDRIHDATVLRPLCGFTKDEIISRARTIGTEALSARAKEVCNLSTGPVIVDARRSQSEAAHRRLPAGLVDRALAAAVSLPLPQWLPGSTPQPELGAATA